MIYKQERDYLVLSKSDKLVTQVTQFLHNYSDSFRVYSFNKAPELGDALEKDIARLKILLLDLSLEDAVDEVFEKLRAIDRSTIMVCGFSKSLAEEEVYDFYVKGGNIFLISRSKTGISEKMLLRLMTTIEKLQSSRLPYQNCMIHLA